jgi:hypothetical protein
VLVGSDGLRSEMVGLVGAAQGRDGGDGRAEAPAEEGAREDARQQPRGPQAVSASDCCCVALSLGVVLAS